MAFLKRSGLIVAAGAAALLSCAEVEETEPEQPTADAEVVLGEGGHAAAYEFEAVLRVSDQSMMVRMTPVNAELSRYPKAQAGRWVERDVDLNGVQNVGPPNTVELFTPPGSLQLDANCFPGDVYPEPPNVTQLQNQYYQSQRALCGDVVLRSFFATELRDVYAVIDEVTDENGAVPASGHFGYQFPLGTGANPPTGENAPGNAFGLWSYGTVPANGSVSRTWIFERRTDLEEIRLRGTILAYYEEVCGDGIDNDFDTLTDEGCTLAAIGDPCTADPQCSTGVCVGGFCAANRCSDGIKNGTETDVDCGGVACSACALGDDCAQTSDCASGAVCSAGICRANAYPTAGQVVITEVFANGATAEEDWFEFTNVSGQTVDIAGCTIADGGVDLFTVPSGTLAASGRYVAAAAANYGTGGAAVTGGSLPAPVFTWDSNFTLSASSDTITLSCPGSGVVTTLSYTAPELAASKSLQVSSDSLTSAASNQSSNRCPSTATVANYSVASTPGAANGSCNIPGLWCRLQWPTASQALPAQSEMRYFSRIYAAGFTDASTANNPQSRIVVQLGYGADGSNPAVDAWTWTNAVVNPLWVPFASPGEEYSNELNNDEYMATLAVPNAAGSTLDVAFRASGDGGANWIYCDRNAGAGADGWQDGYQAANSAGVVVTPAVPAPQPNEFLVSEVMPNPGAPGIAGEWFEVQNRSSAAINLRDCLINSGPANHTIVSPVIIAPGDSALFARSRDSGLNGGLPEPDYIYDGIVLPDTAGSLVVACYEFGSIEVVSWTAPPTAGSALQVIPGWEDLAQSFPIDDIAYCPAHSTTTYGPGGVRRGSPGAANPSCAPVSFCRLQAPATASGSTLGGSISTFGRIYGLGVTDISGTTDSNSYVVVQAGIGPNGTTPSDSWTWTTATPNPAYGLGSPSYEANNDEYVANLAFGAGSPFTTAGDYDFAYRVSTNGGLTYSLICDTGNGNSDGYSAAAAGQLTVTAPRTVGYCVTYNNAVSGIRGTNVNIQGEVFSSGLTENDGNYPGTGALLAQYGYGARGTDPATWTTWTSATAESNLGSNNNWRFGATFPMSTAATPNYGMVMRFAVDGGGWVYCDGDGVVNFPGDYSNANDVDVTATALGISYFGLNWIEYNNASSGYPFPQVGIYAKWWQPGVTDATSSQITASGDVRVEFGYGTVGTEASTHPSWVWAPMTFQGRSGNDHEYKFGYNPNTVGSARGVAVRISTNGGANWRYAYNGSAAPGSANLANQQQVAPR